MSVHLFKDRKKGDAARFLLEREEISCVPFCTTDPGGIEAISARRRPASGTWWTESGSKRKLPGRKPPNGVPSVPYQGAYAPRSPRSGGLRAPLAVSNRPRPRSVAHSADRARIESRLRQPTHGGVRECRKRTSTSRCYAGTCADRFVSEPSRQK